MFTALIGALIGAVAGFISAWFGAFLSARASAAQARRQKTETDAATRVAYLRHLQEELQANRRLMAEMATYVDGGPVIADILLPANVAAGHLRFTAWDALVRAGVLSGLATNDQQLFRTADTASRKAAQDVETIAAIWRRALAWQEWATAVGRRGELVQGIPLDALLRQVQRQIKDTLSNACACTDGALARIKDLLPDNSEPPAT